MRLIEALDDLFFPQRCILCGRWGADLCDSCSTLFAPRWRRVDQQTPFLQLVDPNGSGETYSAVAAWAMTSYADEIAQAIVIWKHSHSAPLTQKVLRQWKQAVSAMNQMPSELAIARRWYASRDDTVVVCAPSRWRRIHQGLFVARSLALALAEAWDVPAAFPLRSRAGRALSFSRAAEAAHQRIHRALGEGRSYAVADLSARMRKRDAVECRGRLDGWRVILVDDVITTGATISGAIRALTQAGARVELVLALAAPPAKTGVLPSGSSPG